MGITTISYCKVNLHYYDFLNFNISANAFVPIYGLQISFIYHIAMGLVIEEYKLYVINQDKRMMNCRSR
jgi:hypothetical protein